MFPNKGKAYKNKDSIKYNFTSQYMIRKLNLYILENCSFTTCVGLLMYK